MCRIKRFRRVCLIDAKRNGRTRLVSIMLNSRTKQPIFTKLFGAHTAMREHINHHVAFLCSSPNPSSSVNIRFWEFIRENGWLDGAFLHYILHELRCVWKCETEALE